MDVKIIFLNTFILKLKQFLYQKWTESWTGETSISLSAKETSADGTEEGNDCASQHIGAYTDAVSIKKVSYLGRKEYIITKCEVSILFSYYCYWILLEVLGFFFLLL